MASVRCCSHFKTSVYSMAVNLRHNNEGRSACNRSAPPGCKCVFAHFEALQSNFPVSFANDWSKRDGAFKASSVNTTKNQLPPPLSIVRTVKPKGEHRPLQSIV